MARPITKKHLIEDLAQASGHSQKDCDAFLTHLGEVVTKRVIAGDTVVLPELVKIEAVDRAEREMRNPSTGEMFTKPAHRAAVAKPVRKLKESLA